MHLTRTDNSSSMGAAKGDNFSFKFSYSCILTSTTHLPFKNELTGCPGEKRLYQTVHSKYCIFSAYVQMNRKQNLFGELCRVFLISYLPQEKNKDLFDRNWDAEFKILQARSPVKDYQEKIFETILSPLASLFYFSKTSHSFCPQAL